MEITMFFVFFLAALMVALGLMPVVIHFASEWELVEGTDERKLHTEQVSNLGGVGILLACVLPILFIVQPGINNPMSVFAIVLPLFFIGLIDDLSGIGVTTRLMAQALVGMLLFEMGFQIIHIEGYWLVNLSATVFFTVLLINAYNFIDGINGLAGGLGLIGSVVFGSLLALGGQLEPALFSFAYGGALLGFLGFNFGKKAKIFMGDNGSTVLGAFMATMIMAILKQDPLSSQGTSWPIIFAIITVPVTDIFKVALSRMMKLKSPFRPDRTHLHHLYTDGLLSHPTASTLLHFWTIALVAIAFYSPKTLTLPMYFMAAAAPYIMAAILRKTIDLMPQWKKKKPSLV